MDQNRGPVTLATRCYQASPRSGRFAVDAIRCAKLGLDRNISGPLHRISAVCMKHPPQQFRDSKARERPERWIAGQSDTLKVSGQAIVPLPSHSTVLQQVAQQALETAA